MTKQQKYRVFYIVLLTIYMTYLITNAAMSVGTLGSCEPFPEYLPFLVAAMLFIPALLGYRIGVLQDKDSNNND